MKQQKQTFRNFLAYGFLTLITLLSMVSNASDGYERGGPFPSHMQEADFYLNRVQPILDKRCTVCHSCFEAPCQQRLTSADNLLRGATAHPTNGGNVFAAPRTDLMLTRKQQRDGGFFSVTEGSSDSILVNLLIAGNNKTDLPPEKYVDIDKGETRQCIATTEKFKALDERAKKKLGMPYYMAPLPPDEFETLLIWASNGAQTPSSQTMHKLAQPRTPQVIVEWEAFFNDRSWKARWTSRYLYEHLFTAHFYFVQSPGEFYELVRSKTAAPNEIDEIATERAFEMPSGLVNSFHYRLRKLQSTVVHKQHFVYKIGNDTMEELKQLFWRSKWNATAESAPFSYEDRNPFVAFEPIPGNARYRWMLKNAKMLLDMDMRSENCHGNGAAGPLRDNFLFLFVRPESDVSVRYPEFFKEANPHLAMANTGVSNTLMNFQFKSNQEKYSRVKYRHQLGLLPNGFSFDDIWDGEDGTQMPFFTIMRHEKTVSVHNGPWGPRPRVSLLFDYVSFERLYYNCVGLTTLFDNVTDKLGTVLYLRDVGREAEEQLLSLIPDNLRAKVRAEWVQGEGREHMFDVSKFSLKFNVENLKDRHPGYVVDPNDPYASMMDYLLLRSGVFTAEVVGTHYYPTSQDTDQYALLKDASQAMSKEVVKGEGNRVTHFPNVSYIVVRGTGGTNYYTMIANRFYEYVNYLPIPPPKGRNPGRLPVKDWMTIFPEITVNYPGKIYVVDESNLLQFIERMKSVKNPTQYATFDRVYGLQKMSSQFWQVIDEVQEHFIKTDIIHNGALDLNDYGVHDLVGSP